MMLIPPFTPEKIALLEFSAVSPIYIMVSVCFCPVVCFVDCTIEGGFWEEKWPTIDKKFSLRDSTGSKVFRLFGFCILPSGEG